MSNPKRTNRLLTLLIAVMLLSGCMPRQMFSRKSIFHTAVSQYAPVIYQEQTYSHLKECFSAQKDIVRPHTGSTIIAAWLPYMLYDTLFGSQDKETCRSTIRSYLSSAKALGINTIFAHACAFGEAYYTSGLMPAADIGCRFDPFALISDECRRLGLSLHAWINPLRLETAVHMEKYWAADDALSARWYQDESLRGKYMLQWEKRWFLNPASDAVQDYICRVAAELLNRYPIDGIHIDDYFYPTISTAFDAKEFEVSGEKNLSEWRRGLISKLVSELYATVHNIAPDAVFSVSPQASIKDNHNKSYADVALWCAEKGYCDWMIPQIYYGFENDTMPFTEVLAEWCMLPRSSSVALMVGIATYKVGAVDAFAGGGANEWVTELGIPAREAQTVLRNPAFSGISLYHLGTTLSMSDGEKSELSGAIL